MTAYAGTEGRRTYSSDPCATRPWKMMGGQHHAPTGLAPRKERVPTEQDAG